MRYKFTNDTEVKIILKTPHAISGIQWPETSETALDEGALGFRYRVAETWI